MISSQTASLLNACCFHQLWLTPLPPVLFAPHAANASHAKMLRATSLTLVVMVMFGECVPLLVVMMMFRKCIPLLMVVVMLGKCIPLLVMVMMFRKRLKMLVYQAAMDILILYVPLCASAFHPRRLYQTSYPFSSLHYPLSDRRCLSLCLPS